MNNDTQPLDYRERLKARTETSSSLTIEAGAGTGKTTLLIERIFELLKTFDISEIAAVTFTEKAAAELQDRLRLKLEQEIAAARDGKSHSQYRRALENFDAAHISTIHSFASGIIRENAIRAGINPEFVLVDEDDEQTLIQDYFLRAIHREDKVRDEWLNRYITLNGRITNLIKLVSNLYVNRDLKRERRNVELNLDFKNTFDTISSSIDGFLKTAQNHCTDTDDKLYHLILDLHGKTTPAPKTEDALWLWLIENGGFKTNAGSQKNWDNRDTLKNLKAELSLLKQSITEILERARMETLEWLLDWLWDIVEAIDQHKRKNGDSGFQDLLLRSRELLELPDVVDSQQERLKRLLIDEFQDTDPIQVDIAMALSTQLGGDAADKLIEPGRLCIVGDPKQSIYRFRRADTDIYTAAAKRIQKTGISASINQNFRSAPGIIGFVNALFESQWGEAHDDTIPYLPIQADPNRKTQTVVPPVTVLQPDDSWDYEGVRADDIRDAEAEAIAAHLLKTKNENRKFILDKKRNKFRSANWRDFTLLFPTVSGLEYYTTALRKNGIPTRIEGGKRFYTRQSMIDLYSCLSAIDDPFDTLSVVGALRSMFFGVTDQIILEWKLTSDDIPDYRKENKSGDKALSFALEILNYFHAVRKRISVDRLLRELIDRTQINILFHSDPDLAFDIVGLDRIVDHARTWSSNNGNDLRGFKRWFARKLETEDDTGELPMDATTDGVRLMTVHAAKGLEFPVVYLANIARKMKHNPPVIIDHVDKDINVGIGSNAEKFKTRGYDSALGADKRKELAERMRLLYVALTRARDALVIPSFYKKTKMGVPDSIYHSWLAGFMETAGDRDLLWSAETMNSPQSPDHVTEHNDNFSFDIGELHSEKIDIQDERKNRLDHKIQAIPKVIRPSTLPLTDSIIDKSSPATLSKIETSKKTGNAFHYFMAKCPVSHLFDESFIKLISQRHEISYENLYKLVLNAFNSDIWSKVLKANLIMRETPVYAIDGENLTIGVIDLLWQDNDGSIHIADYKTGIEDNQTYFKQLQQYNLALEKVIDKRATTLNLYYVSVDRCYTQQI